MRKNFGPDNFSRRSYTSRDICIKRDKNHSGRRKSTTKNFALQVGGGTFSVVSDIKPQLFDPSPTVTPKMFELVFLMPRSTGHNVLRGDSGFMYGSRKGITIANLISRM